MFFSGRSPRWHPFRAAALTFALALPLLAHAKEGVDAPQAVALTTLPAQAQAIQRSILAGGPFIAEKDGSAFGNRERLLAVKPRGYYREYTVPTPGVRHRGARRIVCGGARPTRPEACFYTDDHYASFRRIVQ